MSMMLLKKNRYFESQEEDEEVMFALRRHPIILATPFIVAFLVILISGALYFLMTKTAQSMLHRDWNSFLIVILGLVVLYVILYAYMAWLIRYLNVFILTNKHLVEIEQVSLFNRKISVLGLDHIEDVTSEEKGFIKTIFDFGNVNIQTAGEQPNFYFCNYKDPEGIEKKIMEAKEAHERQFHPMPTANQSTENIVASSNELPNNPV